jgi:MFS family permease
MSEKPEAPSQAKGLPRNVWAATVTSFLTDISSEMIFHLLPLFLANVLGVRTVVIGLIEGLAETTSSLLKLVSGWLSDRLGQRKWLAVAGYGLSTLVKPLLAIAGSWPVVLVVRWAERIGKGIRTAPRDALVADSIDDSQRGRAFGLHRAGDTAGALLGTLIAMFVIWRTQAGALLLERETFRTVVLLSIIPAALAVLVLALGTRDVPITSQREAPLLAWRGLDRRFRLFLLAVVIFTLGNSADAFVLLRAQERGLSLLGVMGMVASMNLVYTLVSSPAGVLSDRIGRRRLIVFGWGLYAIIYLGFAIAQVGWQVWALFTLYGAYYGTTEGVARAFVADLVPAEQRGAAYGLYHTLVGLSAFPASLLAGLVWQGVGAWGGFGPAAPFLLGAGLAGLAVVVLMAARR